MELDHIIPKNRGGKNEIGNLQWVHSFINMMKRDHDEAEFFSIIRNIYEHRREAILANETIWDSITPCNGWRKKSNRAKRLS
jgi:5-methylcytosine-specific restriction endonuclease McrA